jgi:hypothetical protein
VTLAAVAPSFSLLDGTRLAGIVLRSDGSGADGGWTHDIIGPTGSSLGYPTVAATAGDVVELFAVGLGPTTPTVSAGQVFSGSAPTNNPVSLLINGTSVTPFFAGLTEAGLYQIQSDGSGWAGYGRCPAGSDRGGRADTDRRRDVASIDREPLRPRTVPIGPGNSFRYW